MLVLKWKERAFMEKVNSRCFCWFLVAISGVSRKHRPWKHTLCFLDTQFVYQNCTQIWHLHSKLYNGAWNVSANNLETVGHKDLRLGQFVYISVFCNISFSWLLPLDSFQLIFCAMFIAWQWKWSIVFYFFSALLMFHTATWCSSLPWQAQELILLVLPLWVIKMSPRDSA